MTGNTFSTKYVSPASKFGSELDPTDPADLAELQNRVFGRDHKKDRHGNPVEQGRGSDAWWVNGDPKVAKLHAGHFQSHINAIRKHGRMGVGPESKGPYLEDAENEMKRINAFRAKHDFPPLTA